VALPDATFTFQLTAKQRPKFPQRKYAGSKCVEPTEAETVAYLASDDYKTYNEEDTKGRFKLVFEGGQTVTLSASHTEEDRFWFEIPNSVEPWIDDLEAVAFPDGEFGDAAKNHLERLEASLLVHRHSDGALASIWMDIEMDQDACIEMLAGGELRFGGQYCLNARSELGLVHPGEAAYVSALEKASFFMEIFSVLRFHAASPLDGKTLLHILTVAAPFRWQL